MITKFIDFQEHTSIEFQREKDTLLISIEQYEGEISNSRLTESDLFSLIGQLLRIQSEIKKEVNNV